MDEAIGDMMTRCQDAVLQKHRNEELIGFLKGESFVPAVLFIPNRYKKTLEQIAQLDNRLKSLQPARRRIRSYNGKENGATPERYALQNGDVSHGEDGLTSNYVLEDTTNIDKQLANALQGQKLAELEVENYKGKQARTL